MIIGDEMISLCFDTQKKRPTNEYRSYPHARLAYLKGRRRGSACCGRRSAEGPGRPPFRSRSFSLNPFGDSASSSVKWASCDPSREAVGASRGHAAPFAEQTHATPTRRHMCELHKHTRSSQTHRRTQPHTQTRVNCTNACARNSNTGVHIAPHGRVCTTNRCTRAHIYTHPTHMRTGSDVHCAG